MALKFINHLESFLVNKLQMAAHSSPKVLRRVSWYCSSVSSGIRPLAVIDQEYGRQHLSAPRTSSDEAKDLGRGFEISEPFFPWLVQPFSAIP
jgi:hypothetical protein